MAAKGTSLAQLETDRHVDNGFVFLGTKLPLTTIDLAVPPFAESGWQGIAALPDVAAQGHQFLLMLEEVMELGKCLATVVLVGKRVVLPQVFGKG